MNQNSALFHTKIDDTSIVSCITSFYQERNIDLKFQLITSYFNYKSYKFFKSDDIKLSDIQEYTNDLINYLKVKQIRVAYKGENYIFFEIFNEKRKYFDFFDAIENEQFQNPDKMELPILLGERNGSYLFDLAEAPHLLIGGRTGTGKSVFIHSLLLSLLYHRTSETLKLILIDLKVVELSIYRDIPHLLTPVITNPEETIKSLSWCLDEMERRYLLLSQSGVNNIVQYNDNVEPKYRLPYIVLVIDEFSDFILMKGEFANQFEEYIARIARKAKSIGIHLVLATQRASDDIIKGVKANIPSRIAFTVSSSIDSRTIIDTEGAESLCGFGDMLFSYAGSSDLLRVQAPLINDNMIFNITNKLRPPINFNLSEFLKSLKR